MQVIILGAGIVGLASAYALLQRGYEVTVIDQHDEVGHGTTFANGAQLSYSYVAPLAGPGVISKVPKWLLNPDSPLRFKPSLNPSDICWLLRFLKACNATRSEQTTAELLKLAYLSRDIYHELFKQQAFADIDFSRAGKLVVHRSQHSMDSAVRQFEVQQRLGGMPQQALSAAECVEKEPALAPIASQLVGGIYTDSEEAADAYKVTLAFKHYLQQQGVKFLFNTRIQGFTKQSDNTVSVHIEQMPTTSDAVLNNKALTPSAASNSPLRDTLFAEHIVVCLGIDSKALLETLGIHVPIAPLKGYSLTLDIENDAMAPRVSITDFERKVVYARLGNRLRLAGMADLVGMDTRIDSARIKALIAEAQSVFAQAGDYTKAVQWAGLRPATPLGKPIIDATPFKNLFINIGHGALGLTLATGSANILADRVTQQTHPLQSLFTLTAAR